MSAPVVPEARRIRQDRMRAEGVVAVRAETVLRDAVRDFGDYVRRRLVGARVVVGGQSQQADAGNGWLAAGNPRWHVEAVNGGHLAIIAEGCRQRRLGFEIGGGKRIRVG